ncbi:MAG: aminopeptidase P family protein [Zetaproteobacteria bacterium]|nr:MAG: aminopeptidase P family protein [Zetaproteobacteria bacterium]
MQARVIIANSESNADMLYVSGIFVPDPFIAIEIDGHWHGLFSPLEIDRARKHARLDQVELDTAWHEKAQHRGWPRSLAAAAAAFLDAHGIRRLLVPGSFPVREADMFRSWGFEVQACEGSMFPERAIKQEWEIHQLARAERLTRKAMQLARNHLAECSIDNRGFLRHPQNPKRLKSADVRRVIEGFLISHGALPMHTIVACGKESSDPHNTGHGFLRAGQPIIIDIFPRLQDSGYWGDMTRTFVKGRPNKKLSAMHEAVREAQKIGLDMVQAGINARTIHERILAFFTEKGFVTGMRRGRQVGFFHGTGHGVGLEIHEEPRISRCDAVLKAGNVVTVEPGLYYPGIGGVRLEDLVVVRESGCENLTRYTTRMEID